MRSTAKPLIIVSVLYFIGLGYAATLAVVTFPGDQVHEAFTLRYMLLSGLETFFVHLFAFHGAGVLLAYSLFLSPQDLRGGE